MKKYKWIIILVNLLVILAIFNKSIFDKEELNRSGDLILLELAPIDPRSLIQGDYMMLNYAISIEVRSDSIPKRGYCVVQLTENKVAEKLRLQTGREPLNENEYLIEYTNNAWRGINIGAESYFFQEGEGAKYEKAKYGGVKVDASGNSLLVGLYDEHFTLIE